MGPFEFVESINKTKVNLIRESGNPDSMTKLYNPFLTARTLSYHRDVILIVNELNRRGLVDFGITPLQHYEFLINIVPKGNRRAKWSKPEKDEDIETLANYKKINLERARELYDLMSDEERADIKNLRKIGGAA